MSMLFPLPCSYEHSFDNPTPGNVSEIAEKGTDIVKVSATDQDLGVNAQISYSIVKIASVGGNNGNNADVIR